MGGGSLTRGRVCNLQLLLCLASAAFSRLSTAGIGTIFYCLSIETPQNWGARFPALIFPRNRVALLYRRALGSLFVASYNSQG
jgi:hypothetical protein